MSADAGVLAPQFDDLAQQRGADRFGMWLFLVTEALLFGGLFTGYTVYRIWFPREFAAASSRLNLLIAAVNTLVLLASSLTMALAVHAAKAGTRRTLTRCLALTALLGLGFLGLKVVEYTGDVREHLVPGPRYFRPEEWLAMDPPAQPTRVQLFLIFYYVMTGTHAVHLIVGVGLVGWLLARALRGRLTPARYVQAEVVGLYWHFVDLVWIFLLPLLYLIGTRSPSDLHF
jgi:cytochrome c oxidase subunit III